MAKTGRETAEGVETKQRQQVKKPPLYRVLLLNDDYTTMDFVVYVLETIFHRTPVEATRIMLQVHRQGKGVAGVYTREIAETKIDAVHRLATENEFPLRCVLEKE